MPQNDPANTANHACLRVLPSCTVDDLRSGQSVPSYESLAASLLHNAIDRGATSVILTLQPASLRMTVADNGPGFQTDEWRRLLVHDPELQPSDRARMLLCCAAVAHVRVSSSRAGQHVVKEARAGALLADAVRDARPSRSLLGGSGVVVDVSELFHNLPVRRRAVLAVPPAEFVDRVRRRVVAIALSNLRVHVKLEMHRGIVVFDSPRVDKMTVLALEKAFATPGGLSWVPVSGSTGRFSVDGFVAEAALSRAADAQLVSVNGTPLGQAARVYELLQQVFRDRAAREPDRTGRARPEPAFALSVRCPPGDVQLSPPSHGAQVFGFRKIDVEQLVVSSVDHSLRAHAAASDPRLATARKQHAAEKADRERKKKLASILALRSKKRIWSDIDTHDFLEAKLDLSRVAKRARAALEAARPASASRLPSRPLSALELRRGGRQNSLSASSTAMRVHRPRSAVAVLNGIASCLPGWTNPCFGGDCGPRSLAPARAGRNSRKKATVLDVHAVRVSRDVVKSLRVLGQVDTKFIMAAGDGTVYAIDQHAASERAHFEATLRSVGDGTVQSDPCSPVMRVRLSGAQRPAVERHWRALHRWGWRLAWGKATLHVLGTPVIGPSAIPVAEAEQLLDVVDSLAGGASPAAMPKPFREAAASAACHVAVRFGDTLSVRQCAHIIEGIADCEDPFACAHGRPSVVPLAKFADEKK